MNKTKLLGLALAAAFVGVGILTPADASAQRRHRSDYDRPVRQDWKVRPLVDTTERQSNAFRKSCESHDSRGRLGRYHDNRYLKDQIQSMDEAFERLRSRADDRRPGVGKDQLVDALNHARQIDREIYDARDTKRTIREWNDLRGTLNRLADLYDVRGV